MPEPSVHSRQFVLGPQPTLPKAGWLSVRLGDDLVLSHCPKLKLARVVDRRDRQWLLLGLVAQVDANRPSPEEDLRSSSAEDIASVYESWAGRWILVGDGTIHLDAGGLLGCYYWLASDAAGKQRLWMSSSLALLASLPGAEGPVGEPRRLAIGHGFSWDPPPRTGYAGIRKLLPTQILDTTSGRPRPRPIALRAAHALTYDQVLDSLAGCFVTATKNIEGRIWLALSAGYDSRLLLAAAQVAGIPFGTYTQTFPTMTAADRTIPPLLSKLVDVEHRRIDPGEADRGLLSAFDEHCGGQNVDADRTFFMRQQWSWARSGDVMLRGLGGEVGTCYYWNQLPPDPLPADALLRAFGATGSPQYVRDSIADYLDWIDRMPIDGLDWRDRFYLEVRFAGWASAAEQSLDIVDGSRFYPTNSHRIFELLLAVPVEKRRVRQHHVDLIERLSPELLRYPFNAPDGLIRVAHNRLRKYGALLRDHGLAATFRQANAAIQLRLKGGKGLH